MTVHVGLISPSLQSIKKECNELDLYQTVHNFLLFSCGSSTHARDLGKYLQSQLENLCNTWKEKKGKVTCEGIFNECAQILNTITGQIFIHNGIVAEVVPKLQELQDDVDNRNIKNDEKECLLSMFFGVGHSKHLMNQYESNKKSFLEQGKQMIDYWYLMVEDRSWYWYFSGAATMSLVNAFGEWFLSLNIGAREVSTAATLAHTKKNKGVKARSKYFGELFCQLWQIGLAKYFCPKISRNPNHKMKILGDMEDKPRNREHFLEYFEKYKYFLKYFMDKSNDCHYIFNKVVLHRQIGTLLHHVSWENDYQSAMLLIQQYGFDENDRFIIDDDEKIDSVYDQIVGDDTHAESGGIEGYFMERRKKLEQGNDESGPNTQQAKKEAQLVIEQDTKINAFLYCQGLFSSYLDGFHDLDRKAKGSLHKQKQEYRLTIDATMNKKESISIMPQHLSRIEFDCIYYRLIYSIDKLLPIENIDVRRLLKYYKMTRNYEKAFDIIALLLKSGKKSLVTPGNDDENSTQTTTKQEKARKSKFANSWFTKFVENCAFMNDDVTWILKYLGRVGDKNNTKQEDEKEDEKENKSQQSIIDKDERLLISSAAKNSLSKLDEFDAKGRLFTFKDLFLEYLHPQIEKIKINVKNALIKAKKTEKDKKYYHLVKQFDVDIKQQETEKEKKEKEMKHNGDEYGKDYSLMVEHDQEMSLLKYGASRHTKKDTLTCINFMAGKKDSLSAMKLLDLRYFAKARLIADIINPSFLNDVSQLIDNNNQIHGVKFIGAPIKGLSRCMDKAETKYSMKPYPRGNNVKDIMRCSIICDNFESMYNVECLLKTKIGKGECGCINKIERYKNGLKNLIDESNYWDKKYNVFINHKRSSFTSHGEIQIILKATYDAKADLHSIYGVERRKQIDIQVSQHLYQYSHWNGFQNLVMMASDKDQATTKQMIDLCWYNPLLMARMRGNGGQPLLFDIATYGTLSQYEVLLDCLNHFSFQFNKINGKNYINYYLSEADPMRRGINLHYFGGLSLVNLHLKENSRKASLITTICQILNGVDDNWQAFQYDPFCDDKYLKFLEIVLYNCYQNKDIRNILKQSSGFSSFIARIVCCRNLSMKFLYFILTTFDGLEIKSNDIQNVYEYHNGDEMIDTIVKMMKDRIGSK